MNMTIDQLELETDRIHKRMVLQAVKLGMLKSFELEVNQIEEIYNNIEKEIEKLDLC